MKITGWLPLCALAIALAGCTGDGVPQEDYDAALSSAKKLKMQVEDLESQLDKAKEEAASAPTTSVEKVDTSELEKKIDEALKEIETKQEELDKLKDEFRDYKTKYRLTVREKIIGKEVAMLKTADGEVFKDVVVKDFSAVGMRITHSGGTGRIRFENLDKQLQDQLGYDKEEADAIIAEEMAAKAAAQAKIDEAIQQGTEVTPEAKKSMSVSSMEREIAKLDSWVKRAQVQYQAINREAMAHEAKARYAKSRGRISYDGKKAEEKKQAASAINSQIRAANSELKTLRRKLRAAKR